MSGAVLLGPDGRRLLHSDGSLVVDDGQGNTCCCRKCQTCAPCGEGCQAPHAYLVTIAGTVLPACCSDGHVARFGGQFDEQINGTYTIPFKGPTAIAGGCIYERKIPWTHYRGYGLSAVNCEGTVTAQSTELTVRVTLIPETSDPATIRLEAFIDGYPLNDLFVGETDLGDCDDDHGVTNILVGGTGGCIPFPTPITGTGGRIRPGGSALLSAIWE